MHKSVFFALFLIMSACSTVPHGTTESFTGLNPETNKMENLSFVTYDTPSLKKFCKKYPEVQLVDVRTPKEYDAGHIEKAVLIDMKDKDFEEKAIRQLDTERPVVVYCQGGVRSRKAARILVLNGFKVYNLDKGYDDWIK